MELIKYPNITHWYLLKYKDEFLKINNLKIGDTIELEFDSYRVHSGYKSRDDYIINHKKLSKGILKEDENGYLLCESLEDMQYYKSNPKYKSSRYIGYKKRCIKRIGTGFIYK